MTRSYGLTTGTQVRIERDEIRYPTKGSWRHYRGRTGTIVQINRAGAGGIGSARGARRRAAMGWDK